MKDLDGSSRIILIPAFHQRQGYSLVSHNAASVRSDEIQVRYYLPQNRYNSIERNIKKQRRYDTFFNQPDIFS
jgi:hypothetical protein